LSARLSRSVALIKDPAFSAGALRTSVSAARKLRLHGGSFRRPSPACSFAGLWQSRVDLDRLSLDRGGYGAGERTQTFEPTRRSPTARP
jgi:hypothetical protein